MIEINYLNFFKNNLLKEYKSVENLKLILENNPELNRNELDNMVVFNNLKKLFIRAPFLIVKEFVVKHLNSLQEVVMNVIRFDFSDKKKVTDLLNILQKRNISCKIYFDKSFTKSDINFIASVSRQLPKLSIKQSFTIPLNSLINLTTLELNNIMTDDIILKDLPLIKRVKVKNCINVYISNCLQINKISMNNVKKCDIQNIKKLQKLYLSLVNQSTVDIKEEINLLELITEKQFNITVNCPFIYKLNYERRGKSQNHDLFTNAYFNVPIVKYINSKTLTTTATKEFFVDCKNHFNEIEQFKGYYQIDKNGNFNYIFRTLIKFKMDSPNKENNFNEIKLKMNNDCTIVPESSEIEIKENNNNIVITECCFAYLYFENKQLKLKVNKEFKTFTKKLELKAIHLEDNLNDFIKLKSLSLTDYSKLLNGFIHSNLQDLSLFLVKDLIINLNELPNLIHFNLHEGKDITIILKERMNNLFSIFITQIENCKIDLYLNCPQLQKLTMEHSKTNYLNIQYIYVPILYNIKV
ncbi:hypothetical protein ABK040_003898 [Willaertia magna]